MDKEELQKELPLLEEMLSIMEEQQGLILEITEDLKISNRDLKTAQQAVSEKEAQITSLKELVQRLNSENERLMEH